MSEVSRGAILSNWALGAPLERTNGTLNDNLGWSWPGEFSRIGLERLALMTSALLANRCPSQCRGLSGPEMVVRVTYVPAVFFETQIFFIGDYAPSPLFQIAPWRLSWVHITNSNCWIISIRSNSIHSLSAFPHCIISNGFLVDHNEMAFYCVFILHSHYLSSYSFFQENMQFTNIKNMHVWACASSFPLLLYWWNALSQSACPSLFLFVWLLWWEHLYKAFDISTLLNGFCVP